MKKILKKEKKNILIGIISLIALIIGSSTIGFLPSFIVILIIDILILTLSRKKKTPPIEKLKSFLIVCFCCFIFLLLVGIGFGAYIAISAPEFTPEKLYNKEATLIYDKNGDEFAKLGVEERKTITYDELSESLIDAIIATEDSRFFQHSGIDLPRFLKASASQVLGQGGGGASTLTMQVVKNTFTSTTSTGIEGIIRKFTDIYMSVFKIETKYTKEQIIEFYINSNCMGGKVYGVEQASLTYFGKHASELNVAEAAMIAGMFQAPNAYNPYVHPEECELRRQTVLSLMLKHNYINQEEYEIAKELSVDKLLVTTSDANSNKYQAFIDTVVEEVIARTNQDPYSVSMKIYTKLDPAIQENMDNVMNGTSYTWKTETVQAGSVILDVDTGALVAVGAGHNRTAGGWNYATMNKRQMGSTAKPLYDYGPGIEYNNWSTATVITDEPYSYSDGKNINNWDGKYYGYTVLHDALKYSRNIPALKAFQQLDNEKVLNFVTTLGLSPEVQNGHIYETHAIGGYNGESPLTVAAAYAAFSNGGYYNEPHSFTRLVYTDTNKEFVVKPKTSKAMSPATAYMITKVLEDTSSYAIARNVNGVNYCAKSGTTDLDKATKKAYGLPNSAIADKWVASFNDTYAIAVWYGYNELNKDNYLTLGDSSSKDVFKAIAKGAYTKNSSWDMPSSVVKIEIEKNLDKPMLPSEYTPENLRKTAYFKKGFEPTEISERFSKLENVKNLNYDENTSTLSWNKITTPKFNDNNYLNEMASNIFTDEGYKSSYINEIINYNNSYIGNVIYNVYTKKNNELTLIGSTSENNYKYNIEGEVTFVVKTSYSMFKNNTSDGSEFTITIEPSVITSELNSESVIELNIGDEFEELDKPIIVLEDGTTDVTDQADISISVKKASNNQIYDSTVYINTLSEETYTITYDIKYNNYSNTLTKIITIK